LNLTHYPRRIQKLVESVLYRTGHTLPTLRQSIEAYTARDHGAARNQSQIPPELVPYVEKISRHAYKVTDQDITTLKQAGYSEDQILEITISASLGPALARLERGLSLLDEES
jgi:alkylhydroperoxidase family enzyme